MRELEGEGDRLGNPGGSARQPFNIAFELLIKGAQSEVENRVRGISSAGSVRRVSGRLFSSWGGDGVDSLQRELLVMLAAYLTPENTTWALAWLDWLSAEEQFGGLDGAMPDLRFKFQLLEQALTDGLDVAAFEKGVTLLTPGADIPARRSGLIKLFSDARAMIEAKRNAILAARPLDLVKMQQLRTCIGDELLTTGPALVVFTAHQVGCGPATTAPEMSVQYGEVSKEALLEEALPGREFEPTLTNIQEFAHNYFAGAVFRDFFHRPSIHRPVQPDALSQAFWTDVYAAAVQITDTPILLIDNSVGQDVMMWAHLPDQKPGWFNSVRAPQMPSGNDIVYVTTSNGVSIYQTTLAPDVAYLFSGHALKKLTWHELPGRNFVFDVAFVAAPDLTRSHLLLTCLPTCIWDQSRQFEFSASKAKPAPKKPRSTPAPAPRTRRTARSPASTAPKARSGRRPKLE